MRDVDKNTQTGAAVEGAESHRLAHDGSPSSAAASACDDAPFEGWKYSRKVKERETARERADRLRLEAEAAENFNHDPLGVVKS